MHNRPVFKSCDRLSDHTGGRRTAAFSVFLSGRSPQEMAQFLQKGKRGEPYGNHFVSDSVSIPGRARDVLHEAARTAQKDGSVHLLWRHRCGGYRVRGYESDRGKDGRLSAAYACH